MTSIIRMTVLSGGQDEGPPCYLLQVDEFNFLLDCGWDENFDMEMMERVKRHIHQIDAVLLSHPDLLHLGAIPYLVGKCQLKCPIYATVPVHKMGQMFMYDLFLSRNDYEDFDLFSLDDIDDAFSRITALKYSQHVHLTGKGNGLTITPYAAGHMVGGTIWKIIKDGEEDIIYAVDYNHKKERHLNGSVLETLTHPSLLITDAYNAQYNQAKRRDRDQKLISRVLNALRSGGNVLIAVDTAGRVLELSLLLDHLWRKDPGLSAYPIALLNHVSYNVVEFAKSQVEWMCDKVLVAFEDNRNNPFQFKYIQLCHSLNELSGLPEPKVVLASSPDLTCGFARDLFLQWAGNSKNLTIFTGRSSPGTLGRHILDERPQSIDVTVKTRVELSGNELEEYLQKEREKEKVKELDGLKFVTIDSDDELTTITGGYHTGKVKRDLMIKDDDRRSSFFKKAVVHPMYPFSETRIKWDEYGEIINPEDFTLIDVSEEDKPKKVTHSDRHYFLNKGNPKIPTKCVSFLKHIDINCRISLIDFEGRSDGESIRNILSLVNPRHLVLVRGSSAAVQELGNFCRQSKEMGVRKVFTPVVGQTVDATFESHLYQVRLRDSLVSSLYYCNAKDAELAWVDGRVTVTAKGHERLLDKNNKNEDEAMDTDNTSITEAVVPILEPLLQSEIPGHKSVFINDPRLSDLKQTLTKAGIQAEFVGGVIVCNDKIAVRRTETGKITLEGAICNDYYTVRDILYQQYAII
ncbi:uncharacterized protein TRIADDRAFT_30006 [Trichoplax adhaerens]|uniref:Cleavage and polyadenylation specificity factor subunit 2 n=1 Tax=Trichoplax adhaerens TaxID=10228 RepID=B3S6C6_TRIAD|nr:hypothetical protein TRIADDRAFT_30006 [Trichoplax adhaerens]EDV21733.1 hypothetical protein TRIADDRAFT_30006 [Trichoplax adhaerens]|eukprot:XP_002115881.1 hypothetical protein TRIADDRAFT_30006 [Trichoplax adhaerens]